MAKYGSFKYGDGTKYGRGESALAGWTLLGGGNHGGLDWTIDADATIAGNHYNVGALVVGTGVALSVAAYTGSLYGSAEIHARDIDVRGTLQATRAGYGGGGAGGGGGGAGRSAGAAGGAGGAGSQGSAPGATGSTGSTGANVYGGNGGAGGAGAGTYGGTGGIAGTTGQLNGAAGAAGTDGGYLAAAGQGDATTDTSVVAGSGGGGGGGGKGGGTVTSTVDAGGGAGGGGAGNPGGAWLKLYSSGSLRISGNVLAHGGKDAGRGALGGSTSGTGASASGGVGGAGGAAATVDEDSLGGAGAASELVSSGGSGGAGGAGGIGAGGGILLHCDGPYGIQVTSAGRVRTLGGGAEAGTGGSAKIFSLADRAVVTGDVTAGRDYRNETLSRSATT